MTQSNARGPANQPPQAPFDLWRTAPGRPSFPFLWVILVMALGGLFVSGFWLRGGNLALQPERAKPAGDDAASLLPAIPPPELPPSMQRVEDQVKEMYLPGERDLLRKSIGGPSAAGVPSAPVLDPATAQRAADAERRRRELEAKAVQRDVLAEGSKAREAMARWKAELERWDAVSAKLLDGEEGKPIAGEVEFVRQFRAALRTERPSREDYEQAAQGLEQIVGPIERASQDPSDLLRPGQESTRAIAAQASRANAAATQWKEAVQEMNALAILARRRGLVGKVTLRQAIEDLETEIAAERLKEKNAKLVEAEKKAAETDAAIAAARITGPAEIRKAQAEDEQKKKVDEAERLRRRQFARGEEVRRYLTSLMEHGFTQPEPWGNIATPKKVGEEGPVSLTALRSSGCLAPGIAGQARLASFMVHPSMDRTKWGMFPEKELWKPDQQRFIVRAQQLLIEYGEAMVEEGLLAR